MLTGGAPLGRTGFFVQPTLFGDVNADMQIVREEIFGPVGVVVKFKDEAEAVALANSTEYGLVASVYTQDLARATRLARAIEAGSVYVRRARFVMWCGTDRERRLTRWRSRTGACLSEATRSPVSARTSASMHSKGMSGYLLLMFVRLIPSDRFTNVKAVHVNIGQRI